MTCRDPATDEPPQHLREARDHVAPPLLLVNAERIGVLLVRGADQHRDASPPRPRRSTRDCCPSPT